jgi:hypothetical protein
MIEPCKDTTIKAVNPRWPIRAYMWLRGISPLEALNCGEVANETADTDIAAQLKIAINQLHADAIDPETGRVDYAYLANSQSFQDYKMAAKALHNFNPWRLNTPAERKAFWINLYNALIIHAVIAYGAQQSPRDIRDVFDRAAYIVGGYRLSANDIEHGILRANAGHLAFPGPQFARSDPRYAFRLNQLDPRVHFTLGCAAESCPPISNYQAENLDEQLNMAARNFINNGGVLLDHEQMTVSLSRIFSWYASDFGGSLFGYRKRTIMLRYIARFLQSPKDTAFMRENAHQLKVRYLPYDWSLNART